MQCASWDELHGNRRSAIDLFGSVDVDAVRVIDGGGQPSFSEEAFAGFGGIERMTKNFQRHTTAAVELLGLEHRTHSSVPERAHNPVSAKRIARHGKLHRVSRSAIRRRR